ncbi:hypothetical protein DFH27DRAFT_613152 [Peziza echinospora]|nr:hypothetical protein DFH27DRAFT_613152 [Peziza echinospora]
MFQVLSTLLPFAILLAAVGDIDGRSSGDRWAVRRNPNEDETLAGARTYWATLCAFSDYRIHLLLLLLLLLGPPLLLLPHPLSSLRLTYTTTVIRVWFGEYPPLQLNTQYISKTHGPWLLALALQPFSLCNAAS